MLESRLRAPTLAQGLALRIWVILASADGEGVRPMARRLGVAAGAVAVLAACPAGAKVFPACTDLGARTGRPRRITANQGTSGRSSATLRKPKTATHWSARRLTKEVRLFAGHGPSASGRRPRLVAALGRELQVQPRPRVRPGSWPISSRLLRPAGAGPGAVRG